MIRHYKHLKTGTIYMVIAQALASDKSLGPQVVYQRCVRNPATGTYVRSPDGSNVWTRPIDEFYDGRFEAVSELGHTLLVGDAVSDAAMAS